MKKSTKTEEKLDRRGFFKLGAGVGACITLNAAGATGQEPTESLKPKTLELFAQRRSVRKFKPVPVPREHVMAILDAARLAPTAGNQQPWKFLVIEDRAKLDELKKKSFERRLKAYRADPEISPDDLPEKERQLKTHFDNYLSAPVYVVVLTDSQSRHPEYNDKDGPLAAGYLMLAARALGYGTVFCTDTLPVDLIHEVFAIPERYTRVCMTPIGVPEEWPKGPSKRPLEEFVAFESLPA